MDLQDGTQVIKLAIGAFVYGAISPACLACGKLHSNSLLLTMCMHVCLGVGFCICMLYLHRPEENVGSGWS